MADEIANVNGQDSFAYTGAPGWHGKGQVMPAGATIEEWQAAAGLLYTIEKAPLFYRPACDAVLTPKPAARRIEKRMAQYRSDTGADLGIVGDQFNTLQPRAVLEFFRTWALEGGVSIDTAGALFDGRVYFALATLGDAVSIDDSGRDLVAPYIYISTACDGSRATEVRDTVIRVVCANTDRMAMARGKALDRQSHRSEFDATQARNAVESARANFGAYCEAARALARVKVDANKAADLTAHLLNAADIEAATEKRAFAKVMALFTGQAKGAALDTAKGTAWGYLNAVTEYADFHVQARSSDSRFDSAQDGNGAALKARAHELVGAL